MLKHTIADLYARFLAQEMTYHVAKNEGMIDRIAQGIQTPPAWQELIAENDKVFHELKEEGKYFHEGGGSIFIDYKNLSGSVVPKGGMADIASRFSSSMDKNDFLKEARRVIEEWQVGSGRERKI
ncbi:hypothetical protein KKB64_04415 [Patescibacteria group bacterium]|nr:hypothetical protein [Patescibacteria group bacterium]MBU2459952.1 hypothetical protein [Patescibacteria group bacterium]MBU2544798.1 hypothetical protein [Patescibacteria group bacterium]